MLFTLSLFVFTAHASRLLPVLLPSAGTETFLSLQPGPSGLTLVETEEGSLPAISGLRPEYTPFFFAPVPVNTASESLLTTLAGIGPGLATKIVDYRLEHGSFRGPEDMLKVHGIGPKRLAAIAEQISYHHQR